MSGRYNPPSLDRVNITDPRSLQKWINSVTNILTVRDGRLGNSLDRWLSARDLYEAGITKIRADGEWTNYVGANSTGMIPSGAEGPANYTIPPAPTGLVVAAGMGLNGLQWDDPSKAYGNHSITEVWRADTDNIGVAQRIGTTDFFLYSDSIGDTNVTYYYWIRFVSKAGREGPFNATAGTSGTTGYVVAQNIFVNSLSAISANLGTITAGTVTGATIQTATSGARIVLNASNLIGYDSGGVPKTTLSATTGVLTATGANISGTITITGGSGIASLSDAGALATLSSVDLSTGQVTNKTADNIAETGAKKWAGETGADKTSTAVANGVVLSSGALTFQASGVNRLKVDGANKKIWINSETFGSQGIQAEYNGGTPRVYIGNGATKSFEYNGADVKLGRDTKLLGADAYNNSNTYYSILPGVDLYAKVTTGTANVAAYLGQRVVLRIPVNPLGSDTSQAEAYLDLFFSLININFAKSSRFKFLYGHDTASAGAGRIVYTVITDQGGGGSTPVSCLQTTGVKFFGIKISNNVLYAVASIDGTNNESLSSSGISITDGEVVAIHCEFTPGSIVTITKGASSVSVSTNVPSSGIAHTGPGYVAKNTTTANSNPFFPSFGEFKFLQDE